jgi:peroxiredoxin
MMRKLLRLMVIFMVFITILLLGTRIYKSSCAKKETETRIQTLQHCCFESLSREQICVDEFDPSQATIIIYFHPDCEHCQYEAKEIGLHTDEFAHTNLIMITPDDSIPRIENFMTKNNLWRMDNMAILLDPEHRFFGHFGTLNIPSVFIYKHNKLLKKYIGETKMEAILEVIRNHEK